MALPLVPLALGATALASLGYAIFRPKKGAPGAPGALPKPGEPGGPPPAPPAPGARPGMPPELRAAYQALLANGTDPNAMDQVASQLESYGFTAEAAELRAKAQALRAGAPSAPVSPAPAVITPSAVSPATLTATIMTQTDPLSVRSAPSDSASVLGTVPKGATVTVLNPLAGPSTARAPLGWAEISYGALRGFSSVAYLSIAPSAPGPTPTPAAVQTATYTGTDVALRSAPSTGSTVLTRPPKGAKATVLDWNGAPSDSAAPLGWAKLNYNGTVGYSSKQYLSLDAPAPIAAGILPVSSFGAAGRTARCTAPSGCKLRFEPKPTSQHEAIVPSGALVSVERVLRLPKSDRKSPGAGGWALVHYAGKRGWVPSEWFV